MNKLIFKILSALVLCAFTFTACVDEEDLGDPDRLFRPIFQEVSSGGTWIQLGWDDFTDAKSYDVEISVDSFVTVLRTVSVTGNVCKLEDLDYDTKYQCRIRSIGETLQSDWYVGEDVTTDDYPTLLITPESTDLLDVAVKMRWAASDAVYDHITISNGDTLITIPVTEAERTACQKIVTGLKPTKTYLIRIYGADGSYYGKKSYTTAAAEDFGENVVDLRGLNPDSAYTVLTSAYMDTICNKYAGQHVTIVLDGGVSYKIPAIYFSKNVDMDITTGLSFSGNAILYMNASFGVTLGETVNSLNFSKIIFTEGVDSGKKKTDSNYGGNYLFNFNQSGGNIVSLKFDGCDIRYKRGIIRMQTSATLNTVTINNCLIDSIGGYGVVNVDNAASMVGDIYVKNSTIAHADKMFVATKPTVSPNSITLENVTTCYAPSSNIYIIDFNGKAVPGGITMNKCLIGVGKSNAGINGIRSSSSSISVTDCFKVSDLIWYTADGATAPTAAIDDVVDCGFTSTDLFASPENVNFKITATNLINKIGDPRWW